MILFNHSILSESWFLIFFSLGQSFCRCLVIISSLLSYLVIMTTGQRQLDLDLYERIDWSPLDVWSNTTLILLFIIFIEFTFVWVKGTYDNSFQPESLSNLF